MNDTVWAGLLPLKAKWHTAPVAVESPWVCNAHGRHGEPLWPTGVIGSITHANGYRTVAIAPNDEVSAMGIDMEPLVPLAPAVWQRLFDAAEIDELLALPVLQRGADALARWCLKEALFKALRGRIPIDDMSLCRKGDAWRPAPVLCSKLEALGHVPERFDLRSEAENGWQYAAAWLCSISSSNRN